MYQEHLLQSGVKEYEYLAYISCCGAVIITIEMLALELDEVRRIHTWQEILCVCGYAGSAVLFYVGIPPFIKHFGATMFNMSLIPSMVYSLVFALLVYHSQVNWLFLGGYVSVLLGLSLYCLTDKPIKTQTLVPAQLNEELTS